MSISTANDIITKAFSNIGIENATTSQYADALDALNMMLDALSARGLLTTSTVYENFPITGSSTSYTIGVGGNFNTSKPLTIQEAFIRDSSGLDYPLVIMGVGDYMDLSNKNMTGMNSRPSGIYYDPGISQQAVQTGTIFFYPTPDQAYTFYMRTEKMFTEFASLSTATTFPLYYNEMLTTNLPIRLAVPFGISISPELKYLATESMRIVTNVNSENKRTTATINFPGKSSFSPSDIRTNDGGESL
jgi:hypothetical protein